MPVIMASFVSPVTCTDITNQIQDLQYSMDLADFAPDGFSDTDDSLDEDEQENVRPVSKHTHDSIRSEKRLAQSLRLKSGFLDKRVPLKLHRSFSADTHASTNSCPKSSQHKIDHRSDNKSDHKADHKVGHKADPKGDHKGDHKGDNKGDHKGDNKCDHKGDHKTHHAHRDKSKSHHHYHHHHYHHHHHRHRRGSGNSDNTKTDSESSKETFDINELMPIIVGQCKEDVDVPIMLIPDPVETETKYDFSINSRPKSSYFKNTMALKILLAGEKVQCVFDIENFENKRKTLLEAPSSKDCHCSSVNTFDDGLSSWDAPHRTNKNKNKNRRKSTKPVSSETAFNRLTQTLGKDPVLFHHYKDTCKYMERYRFYHTVGNVGRPQTYSKYGEKTTDTDPYYSKLKNNLRAMNSPFLFDSLPSPLREKYTGSASSTESTRERLRSDADDESNESVTDTRLYSVRERGKALNLAPVREYTVPNLRQTDKIDITQLNQYLNLTTPPNGCIQFEIDESQMKRIGNKGGIIGDNSLLPACSARRGARTLRLGSAEFVKPGSANVEPRWSAEKRAIQRSSTFTSISGQGSLIVGSTVTPQHTPTPTTRSKSGQVTPSKSGKVSPYVQFQKEQQQQKFLTRPQSPPQHVAGQRLKSCERMTEVSSAPKERTGRFAYTHAQDDTKPVPVIRTATVIDFQDPAYPIRDRTETLTLDVNHLGIRGTPFKQSEGLVLYKNRRTATLRS